MKEEEGQLAARPRASENGFASVLKEAIQEKQVGEVDRYNSILKIITDEKFAEHNLEGCIEAFRSCVSYLNKEHETLVGGMLKVDWITRKQNVVESYINFLTELVSAQTFYLRGCLKMLIQKFVPNNRLTTDLEELKINDYEEQFDNVHKAIFALVNIVPTAPRHLLIKLSDLFPYVGKHQVLIQCYIKNLFRITKYMPSLQEKILEVIVDNLLKIDVQICKQDIEEEEADSDSDNDFDHEEMQFDVEIEKTDVKNHKEEQRKSDAEMKNETARKLDNLMLTVFEHVNQTCFRGDCVDWEKAETIYNDLLRVFEMVLLPTHASAYVQFILLYICSFDQYFTNSFLEFCWQRVCDPNVPVVLRQTASAYIGSFVARAKFIQGDVVKTCLGLFSDWIHSYLNVLDSCVYPDLAKHAAFYSVCQTLFYVFVFRFKSLEEEHDWRAYVKKLNLDRIVTCRLNPLKFCASSIVDMFARVTRKYEIVFCYTIIEHNKRSFLPAATGANLRDKKNMLDLFFPFDPYLLKKSSKFIEPLYQEWTGIEGDIHTKEDDPVRDTNDNEDVHNSRKFEDAIMQFSISPGTPRFDICVSPGFHPEMMKNPPRFEE